ncbi:ribosome biogenesis GTPase Der [Patescibacteria group bacterium]|nr:ribosome biogenesis GTPase Der [Patescibacteria group bacterium]
MAKSDTVVIIGRINVGKSTLFNRLCERHRAIVSNIPGTTRDRNFGSVIWRGKTITLIDSGGVDIDTLKNSIGQLASSKKNKYKDSIEQEIIKQTKQALKTAKLVLFLVDSKSGLVAADKELALVLKKLKKPVVLAVNKVDSQKQTEKIHEFYKLGLGDPVAVSAASGLGTGDLLDVIYKKLKPKKDKVNEIESLETIKLAIIGKPNVGKSSLINKLSHQERSIVSAIAQTTREPQDIVIKYKDNSITLIDTAGLRKMSKIKPKSIEKIATQKTLSVIKASDVCLFVLDITQSFDNLDKHLADLAIQSQTSMLVVLNKWDLVKTKDLKKYMFYIDRSFPFLTWAPKIFVSAKTGSNTKKIYDIIVQAHNARNIRVNNNALDKFVKKLIKKHRPHAYRGTKAPFIHTLRQVDINPPIFELAINKGSSIKDNFIKFLESQIREKFEFFASPIKVKIDQRKTYEPDNRIRKSR